MIHATINQQEWHLPNVIYHRLYRCAYGIAWISTKLIHLRTSVLRRAGYFISLLATARVVRLWRRHSDGLSNLLPATRFSNRMQIRWRFNCILFEKQGAGRFKDLYLEQKQRNAIQKWKRSTEMDLHKYNNSESQIAKRWVPKEVFRLCALTCA